MNIAQLAQGLKHQKIDLIAYLSALCEKADAENQTLQAFLPENNRQQRLITQAQELLTAFPQVNNRPQLFGIPVGIKDLFRVDGFETQAGSTLPVELFRGNQASLITKLKQAGALIFAKTQSTEFAFADPATTRNPRNPEHTPGGSSSGSAAAVAADLLPLAFGTQTIGSIIRPAAYCGVVGFKPSYNRIATDGIVPFAQSVDHVGFFTQTVFDAQFVASILCENWQNISFDSNKTLKIAIPKGEYLQLANREIISHFDKTIEKLTSNGVIVEEVEIFNNFELLKELHWNICAAEMALVHEQWFERFEQRYRVNSKSLIITGRKVAIGDLIDARNQRFNFRQMINKLLENSNFDAIICPSTTDFAPKGLSSTGNSIMNLPWTFAGLPTINIPCGTNSNNLPFGFQLVGKFNNDEELLAAAIEVERKITVL